MTTLIDQARNADTSAKHRPHLLIKELAARFEELEQICAAHTDFQTTLLNQIDAMQARIDELMLEFCPDEMTPKQVATWAAHQRAVPEADLPECLRKVT